MVLPAALLVSALALAEDPDRRAARSGDYAAEQAACQQIVAEPAASAARTRCERRLRWLADRQDPDGTFRALTALEQFRQQARALSPAEARAQAIALARDPAAAAQVRQEAALWLAREALDRDAPAEALAWTAPLWQAAVAADTIPPEVADLHTRALLGDGQTAAALAAEAQADLIRSARPREGLPLLLLEQRRARLRTAALVLLAAYLLPALPLAIRGWRRAAPRPRPLGLLALLLVVLAFGGLSILREPTSAGDFVRLLAGLGGLHLLSAGALQALPPSRPLGRLGLRMGAALASLAVGYLVLLASGQLEAVGL